MTIDLAARLRAARADVGLSQRAMAERVGIHWRTWAGYERGEHLPGVAALAVLYEMGFAADWLLVGEGEMHRPQSGQDSPDSGTATDSIVVFDESMFIDLVAAFDDALTLMDVKLDPAKKAEALIMLYVHFRDTGRIDREQVVRTIKLAA